MPTFKIVGYNVDKSIRPRHETNDSHLQSFHAYAVLDRCDMSSFEDAPSQFDDANADVCSVLPSMIDQSNMKQNLAVIVETTSNSLKIIFDLSNVIFRIFTPRKCLGSPLVVSIMLLAYCS